MPNFRFRRSTLAIAVALAVHGFPSAGFADEPRGWVALASVQSVMFAHTQEPLPIGEPPDIGFAIHAAISPPRSPCALRLDAGFTVNGESFKDPAATYSGGIPYTEDVAVGVDEDWATLGLQWDPRPGESWFYVFLAAGGMNVTSYVAPHPGYHDVIVPNAPELPPDAVVFCATAGVGARLGLGRIKSKLKNHSLHLEVEYLQGGAADYVASPQNPSTLGNTDFPIVRGNIAGVMVRFGYAYAFRWGTPR